ncbi:MAG: TonB family protein, partial [Akkermansiaceae bacterium]|nr:TonB family protein [Akkermansiaceae bacterium]
FGPHDDSRRALRLVEAPAVEPARPQWFSFRAAVIIALGILAAGVVWGAMVRVQAYVAEQSERRESPVIVVEAVPALEVVAERVPRAEAVPPTAPSVPPRIVVDAPRPAELPELSESDLTEEPFEVSETWERAAEPFPEAKAEPPPPKPVTKAPRQPRATASRKPAPQAAPKPAPKPRRVEARVLRRVPPVYPGSARRAGVEGRVVVQASVGANGRVSAVAVVSSSGSRVLDSAAVSAVKRWSFSPEQYGGRAVASAVRVPVSFQLR